MGEAVASGLDTAWVARLEYDLLPLLAPPEVRAGPLAGFTMGADYWRAGHGTWGIGLPVQLVLGLRTSYLRVTGGVGADVILIPEIPFKPLSLFKIRSICFVSIFFLCIIAPSCGTPTTLLCGLWRGGKWF